MFSSHCVSIPKSTRVKKTVFSQHVKREGDLEIVAVKNSVNSPGFQGGAMISEVN